MARRASAPQSPSSLARLLETETRLEGLLAETRERARTRISEAERQAKAAVAALDTELADTAARAEGRRSADCAARLAALADDNEHAVARLRSIGPERIAELGHWVSEQVLHGARDGDGP